MLQPGTALAYEIDSHYYLRFALSLTTCFDWNESRIIASGDWGMDENGTTHAEMNPVQSSNKVRWHAFGHSDKRFQELWLRSVQEPDLELRLVKLGQFMHFLEDWEAHAGYGIRLGHARDTFRGHDPDSLGNSYAKNHRMVQSALDHLLATCADLGRIDGDRDRQLIEIMTTLYDDDLMDDLYEASDPNWKRGKTGGFRPDGLAIKLANKTLVETFIETHIKHLPEKNVPVAFEAGGDTGIPVSLQLPFDQSGEIISTRSISAELKEQAVAKAMPDIVLSLDQARIFYRNSKSNRPAGWEVEISVRNKGATDSEAGLVKIVVVDSDDESVLGQTSEPLPGMGAGETHTMTASIQSKRRPEPDVIIGAFAEVGDLSAMNDEDWLMLGDAEEEQPEIPLVTDLDPVTESPLTINFIERPKAFMQGDSVCLLVTAVVVGGDSTERLDEVVFEIVGIDARSFMFRRAIAGRWSAVPTADGFVGGKTFECYQPEPETIALLSGVKLNELEIAVTLEARGVEPHTENFPVDAELIELFKTLGEKKLSTPD